jgi:hypothetical protein
VPVQPRRTQRAADAAPDAQSRDGFDVVDQEVEGGRIQRTSRNAGDDRTSAARETATARASSSAEAQAVRAQAEAEDGAAAGPSRSPRAVEAIARRTSVSARSVSGARAASSDTRAATSDARAESSHARAATSEARTASSEARAASSVSRSASPESRTVDGDARGADASRTALVPQQRSVPVAASVASVSTRQQPQPPRQAEPERPIVHVTIGRIEVRASTPPPAPQVQPQPAPGWTPPVLTLEQYLKRGGSA